MKSLALCLHEYKIDPAYYCPNPGLAFDACLKYTNVKLELLTDEDMHLMFEKGIRGRVFRRLYINMLLQIINI